ncbi:hypothetical protein CBW65_05765 [Tumebacillus avium]|uniref:Uncharacterized protein n=1 Tax=Tumebacillus avium TaxID=1903704 RepID=A0A1Y0IM60_9BACL|nr:hypothetical protein [Tumebacillus avium]ARU60645.1 hypothetical protein CBW65_05765 [Tumebacillus avium]
MAQNNSQERYARHGGVHFTQKASPEEINNFVKNLPEDRRESLFEVLDELNSAGMIQIQNDGVFSDPYGNLHGTEGCYDGEK